MPANKNAMTRCKFLDDLLGNRYHNYNLDDLTDKVNDKLAEMGIGSIGRRSIEKDIKYLESDGPFHAEIERYTGYRFNQEKQKTVSIKCLRYADPSFSIFKKEMSDDEKYLLSELLSLLGQFDGIPKLDALNGLKKSLGNVESDKIISFTKNPIESSNLFGELFNYISQKVVIELQYHSFSKEGAVPIIVHPHLLKEYNRRWYLFATADSNDKLLNFGLERIQSIKPLSSHIYRPYGEDINEFFEDIIGVSLYLENKVERILFWVSDKSKDYVATKALHESQVQHSKDKQIEFHQQYKMLEGGCFFSLDCRNNYELIRELSSFGQELIVLEPKSIQEEVFMKAQGMFEAYKKLRT